MTNNNKTTVRVSETVLRELAKKTIENSGASGTIVRFVLNNLSRSDLKKYLEYLKKEMSYSRVIVESSEEIPNSIKSLIQEKYVGKKIMVNKNNLLGAGFLLKIGDTQFDMSIQGFLNQTIDKLKN